MRSLIVTACVLVLFQMRLSKVEFTKIDVNPNEIRYEMMVKNKTYAYTIGSYTGAASPNGVTYTSLRQFFRELKLEKEYQARIDFTSRKNVFVTMGWHGHEMVLYGELKRN